MKLKVNKFKMFKKKLKFIKSKFRVRPINTDTDTNSIDILDIGIDILDIGIGISIGWQCPCTSRAPRH